MFRHALLTVAAVLLLAGPALAQAPSFPDPERLVDGDAISVAVVRARPDDPGFRALLANAWGTMQSRKGGVPPMLGMALRLMGRGSPEQGLLSFLPGQAVRVDRIHEGKLEPTFAVTLAGWRGLQTQFLAGLASGPDGEPWPTRNIAGHEIILREGQEVPVVARVQGTFLACASEERAEKAVRALTDAGASPPKTRLVESLARVEKDRDLYGVMLNQDGGLLSFLDWFQIVSRKRVEDATGGEDLDELFGHVGLMAWDGDLVDDDRLQLHARFETDGPEAAARLARVLQAAHAELARRERVGEWKVDTAGTDVDLRFSMLGFRKAVKSFVKEH